MNHKNGADGTDSAITVPSSPRRFIPVREFAASVGIPPRTMNRYLEQGLVSGAMRFGPGTKWRIPEGATIDKPGLEYSTQRSEGPFRPVEGPTEPVEARYHRGEVCFEDAVREVSGVAIGPGFFTQLLHNLAARDLVGPRQIEHDAALIERDVRMQQLIEYSLTTADAASRLGVSVDTVVRRLAAGTLWDFKVSRCRLLPPAQFTATGEVPYLSKVIPLIAKTLHPLTVQDLLTAPHPSLLIQGQPVSIVTWLTTSTGAQSDIVKASSVITAEDSFPYGRT